MDSTTGGVLGIMGFLISGGGAIYAAINHKKIRFNCCGKNMDLSVDIDETVVKPKKVTSKEKIIHEEKEPEQEDEDEDDEDDDEDDEDEDDKDDVPPPVIVKKNVRVKKNAEDDDTVVDVPVSSTVKKHIRVKKPPPPPPPLPPIRVNRSSKVAHYEES